MLFSAQATIRSGCDLHNLCIAGRRAVAGRCAIWSMTITLFAAWRPAAEALSKLIHLAGVCEIVASRRTLRKLGRFLRRPT
jgi:hypothetical protein